MSRKIALGVSDRRISLPYDDFSSIVDYIELHLSSWRHNAAHRLAEMGWAERTPIASGLVDAEDGCLLSMTSQKRITARIRQRIDSAATLGVRCVILAAGWNRSLPDGMSVADAQSIMGAFLNVLVADLEEAHVQLLIEPLNKTETSFIHTLQEAYDIIRDTPPQRIGLVYDLYHGRLSGENWKEYSALVTDRVEVIHIAGRHRGLPYAFADSWLSRELSDIVSSGYSGYMSIEVAAKELENLSGLEASLRDIRRFLEECVMNGEYST